jgi:hypothetical protein
MRSTQTGFFDNLVAAAKENPLAAVLIGGGALWLMAGDDRIKGAARSTAAAASGVVDGGVSTMRTAASAIQRTAAPPTAPEMDHIGSLDGEGRCIRRSVRNRGQDEGSVRGRPRDGAGRLR